MYPNLKAEQARRGMNNQQVAEYLGICRRTYENKTRNGKFFVTEGMKLCRLFQCDADYLFATDGQI